MPPSLSLLTALLLPTVTVSPDTVPSRGAQATILRVDAPGMYRIRAASPEGTACEIVDHLRGPFLFDPHSGAGGNGDTSADDPVGSKVVLSKVSHVHRSPTTFAVACRFPEELRKHQS